MKNYCSSCGNEMKPGAVFCGICGAKNTQPNVPNNPSQPSGPSFNQPVNNGAVAVGNKNIKKIGLAIIACLILVFLVRSFGSGGYKKPIDLYAKAISKGDLEALQEAVLPARLHYSEYNFISPSEFKEEMDGVNLTLKVKKKKKVKKKELNDKVYYTSYGELLNSGEVKDAYILDIKAKISAPGEPSEEGIIEDIIVVKTDVGWRILNVDDMGLLF